MGYRDWYERISQPFRTAASQRALNALDRLLVLFVAAAYVILIALLVISADGHLFKALAVPAVTFALVSAARIVVNEPRPYEAHDIEPLVVKDTSGKSMPSRHMSSAVVIACAFAWIWPLSAIPGALVCGCIAFTRIVGGVHYPRDIAVATAVSLLCAAVGFLVVP